MSQQIINIGTLPNDETGDTLRASYDKTNQNFTEVYSNTGWASYSDTIYTDVNTLLIAENATGILQNNAGTVIDTALPTDVTSFYDGVNFKVTPDALNSYFVMNIRFKAKADSVNSYFDYGLDIGTPVLPFFPDGIIFPETKLFLKGANVTHDFNIVSNGYSGADFLANGGIPKLTARNGSIEIWNMEFQIARTHKVK